VPAISIKKQLEALGYSADILCLEDIYSDRDAVIEETKKSFHKDFRLAKMSYRMPTRNKSAIDPVKADELIERLSEECYDSIITFSGFWIPFLNNLMDACGYYSDRIYGIHMDAGYSLSWKGVDHSRIREIWLYNLEQGKVLGILEKPYDAEKVMNHHNAENEKNHYVINAPRILVHGGGWGIGEYASKIETLNKLGYVMDIIIYYPEELNRSDKLNNYYLLDPEWKPDDKRQEYPRLLIFKNDKWEQFGDSSSELNPIRILMQRADAVLSKPGGGTLSDSLITATPLIFGEELAKYEADNKKMWIDSGFAIDYSSFINIPDDREMLSEIKNNLLRAQSGLPHVLSVIGI
jgi:hypothetical protein